MNGLERKAFTRTIREIPLLMRCLMIGLLLLSIVQLLWPVGLVFWMRQNARKPEPLPTHSLYDTLQNTDAITPIDRKTVYRALALELYDYEACEALVPVAIREKRDYWYLPYMIKLMNEGILSATEILSYTEYDSPSVLTTFDQKDCLMAWDQFANGNMTVRELRLLKQVFQDPIPYLWYDDFGLPIVPNADMVALTDRCMLDASIWEEWNRQNLQRFVGFETQTVVFYADETCTDSLSDWELLSTDRMVYTYGGYDLPLLDQELEVLCRGGQIFAIVTHTNRPVYYTNAYIEEAEVVENGAIAGTGRMRVLYNDIWRTFEVNEATSKVQLQKRYRDSVANLQFVDGVLCEITDKREFVRAKLLSVTAEGVELEGYGSIAFADDMKCYKTYGVIEEKHNLESLIVGYDTVRFVLEQGRVAGALITETPTLSNIRVLLRTTGYTSLTHPSVTLTGVDDFVVTYGDMKEEYEAGTVLTIDAGSAYFAMQNRIVIETKQENKGILISSIERAMGTPTYLGKLELCLTEDGIAIVNEVAIEDYLQTVVPSEMPPSYGVEPAKVQAICARSFARGKILYEAYPQYGAHLDDSAEFQVYNNMKAYDISNAGIRETYGLVMDYNGTTPEILYYSTSAGATTDFGVWSDTPEAVPYVKSQLVASDQSIVSTEELAEEEAFRTFIMDRTFPAYERDFDWFRWETEITTEELTKLVSEKLASGRFDNSNAVLVRKTTEADLLAILDESVEIPVVDESTFTNDHSCFMEGIGTVLYMQVTKRLIGGSADRLLIVGSDYTLLVKKQVSIRSMLGSENYVYLLQNNQTGSLSDMLAGSFFCILPDMDASQKETRITGYHIYGGGRGHGVGMPQNAAYAMSLEGYQADELLQFFYPNTQVLSIY